MRPIEMEHTEYAWELQPAAMPVIRSSGAKSMRGNGAAGSQPVDGYFLQRLVDVRPPGMSRYHHRPQRDRGTARYPLGIQERTSGVRTAFACAFSAGVMFALGQPESNRSPVRWIFFHETK